MDYISSSDEEDNDDEDSDDSNSSQNEYNNKKKVKKQKLADVVDVLIDRDKDLSERDLQCRVRKLKMRHQVKSRIFQLTETQDQYEHFKHWWSPSMPDIYFAMHCRHRTSYKKGD